MAFTEEYKNKIMKNLENTIGRIYFSIQVVKLSDKVVSLKPSIKDVDGTDVIDFGTAILSEGDVLSLPDLKIHLSDFITFTD